MKIKEKIGVIGIGNMGSAILDGLFQKKMASPSQVWVCDKIQEKAKDYAATRKTKLASEARAVFEKAEVILLAVKPQDLKELSVFSRGTARRGPTSKMKKPVLISILAGTPIAKIKEILGSEVNLVRAMPNLGAKVGEAITAITDETVVGAGSPRPLGAATAPLRLAQQIFSGCGKTVLLEEKYFDIVTAVSGSGPAYFFLLMELLSQAAVSQGMDPAIAKELAVQTALGAGLLARNSEFAPAELRQQVTSKGGTTAAALDVFEEKGLREIVLKGIEAAIQRGKDLSRG